VTGSTAAAAAAGAPPEGVGKPEVAYAALLQPEETAASEHLADIVQLTQDCAELAEELVDDASLLEERMLPEPDPMAGPPLSDE